MSQAVMDMLVNHEQEILRLRRQRDALLLAIMPWMHEIKATVGAVHMMDGFNKKPHRYDDMLVTLENAIKDCE